MTIPEQLAGMFRSSIRLDIAGPAEERLGASRFGGAPDVPDGFEWPAYTGIVYNETEARERPLAFLAQIDCAEAAAFDAEGLLPKTGLLSFFYEMETQRWGFDPKDAGCARVYWFEDPAALRRTGLPEQLPEWACFPSLKIAMARVPCLPDAEDFRLVHEMPYEDWDAFYQARAALGVDAESDGEEEEVAVSKLLGWPDVIQGPIPPECELVSRGLYLGNTWSAVASEEEIEEARRTSVEGWRLLFQLDTVEDGDFELMFGDSGRIYFYIRLEDLKARRFDRAWLVLQCY